MENAEKSVEETLVMVKPQKNIKNNTKKPKRRLNIIGIVGIIVLLAILISLFFIMRSFTDGGGKPVVGNRFKNTLTPAIEENKINELKKLLKTENVDDVEVNLTSATLRITIDTQDNFDADQIKQKLEESVNITKEVLPFEEYFTNSESKKMYDIEIHTYNVVKDSDDIKKVYMLHGKTGAGAEYTETPSVPKNAKVVEDVTKEVEIKAKSEDSNE